MTGSAANALKGRGIDLSKLNKLSEARKGLPAAGQEVLRVHHSECYSTKQVRVKFSSIESLADSMKTRQLQPCKVWPKDDKGYRICIGERRWRAAVHGDLHLDIIVDPLLVDLTPAEVILYQLTENTQRENLTPKEEAQAVADMFAEGMSARDIAMAKSAIEQWSESSAASWVSRMRKMLTMPAMVEALHDAGLHDVEALNCLTAIHELDPAVCERLIEDGQTSRKATRAALKALKGGNAVPGAIRTESNPDQAQYWGPTGLQSGNYAIEVDRHTDGRYVAVVFIKLADKELKTSWLSDAALASAHIEDVRARVFMLVRDFMLSLKCDDPAEQAACQLIVDYWQITPELAKQPPVATTTTTDELPAKQPPAAATTATTTDELPAKQPPAAPPATTNTDAPLAKLPNAAPTPRNVAGATGLVIHGFLDEDPVVLCLDEVVPGDFVVIQDVDGNRLTVPLDDFTFSSITKV